MKIPKNYLLLGILIALMAVSWIIAINDSDPLGQQARQAEENVFVIEDPSLISKVVLTSSEDTLVLAKEGGFWQVDGLYTVDANSLGLLMAVLQQVEVDRPIARQLRDIWWDRLQNDGTSVEVFSGDLLSASFIAGGDPSQPISYFADLETERIYQVSLPGYNTYLSEIFEQPSNRWRDKRVFTTTWQTLDKVKADYPHEPNQSFEILLENGVYLVPGVSQIDTTRLFNFLDGITFLQLNQFVDTVISREPYLIVEVRDTDPKKSRRLNLYQGLETDRDFFCKLEEDWVIIKRDLVVPLLLKKSELVLKN